jgi:hypothetical protein
LHEGVGFKEVGRISARVTRDEKPIDAVVLAMGRAEWLALHRDRLQARIRAKDREPLSLLADLERAAEAAGASPRSRAARLRAQPG